MTMITKAENNDDAVNSNGNDDDSGVYQSPLSRPLADQPNEQVNVVHTDEIW